MYHDEDEDSTNHHRIRLIATPGELSEHVNVHSLLRKRVRERAASVESWDPGIRLFAQDLFLVGTRMAQGRRWNACACDHLLEISTQLPRFCRHCCARFQLNPVEDHLGMGDCTATGIVKRQVEPVEDHLGVVDCTYSDFAERRNDRNSTVRARARH